MILVNFKIYKETFGNKAIELAKVCKDVAIKTKIKIVPVVSPFDVYRIKNEVGIEVWVQNVDEYTDGAKTGKISPIQARDVGASGAIINHSECRKSPGNIKKILSQWPENFISLVCLRSLGQAAGWAKNIKTDFVAYEPSYLVGSKTKSVSSEKPEVIKKMADLFKGKLLVGAGVHSGEDVKTALGLGAVGILLATDVVKANDPEKELLELAKAF